MRFAHADLLATLLGAVAARAGSVFTLGRVPRGVYVVCFDAAGVHAGRKVVVARP